MAKTGVKTEAQAEVGVRRGMTTEEAIKAALATSKEEMGSLAAQVSDKLIVALIDTGLEMDTEAKRLGKRVDAIKELLKATGKLKGTHSFEGENGIATISDSTSTSMKATDLVKILKELGKQKLFNELVNVKIGEVKKYFGLKTVEPYIKETETKYASASIKAKKEK